MEIRSLDGTKDGPGCDAVVRSLPYFFGDEGGIRDCAAAVRSQRGWVAFAEEIVGFVTVAETFPGCLEITWLAVRADRRGVGLGRALVDRVAAEAVAEGRDLLCTLTLGPSVPEPGVEDGYEGTRRFWGKVGFQPVKELSLATWSDEYALLLVRPLAG